HHDFRIETEAAGKPFESDTRPQWRDARQWRTEICQLGIDVIEAREHPEITRQTCIAMQFRAYKPAPALVVVSFDQAVYDVAGRRKEDKIADVVVESIPLGAKPI